MHCLILSFLISDYLQPETEADYNALKAEVEWHIRLDSIWILKYYKMIFPSLFHSVYTEDQQLHMLYALQIYPGDRRRGPYRPVWVCRAWHDSCG